MNKKICVIGAGYWGKNHLKTFNKLNALGGILDLDSKNFDRIKNLYPGIKCLTSLDTALGMGFDGFTIATPAETHYEIAKNIISAGQHVLIEKPMTLSIAESEELVMLAGKHDVKLMVGHVLLFHPAIIKIKEIIQRGLIGDLQYVYSNRLNLGKVRTEENVFWSLAPHDIAIFQYLIGSFPLNVESKGSVFLQEGIPDSTITTLKYENNVEGHIFVSWLHPFKEHRLVVIGSEAMITFEDSIEDRPLKLFSKKFDLINGVPEKVDGPVQWIPYEKMMPLEAELNYFIKKIQNNKKPLISNGEHGLEVIKILVMASEQLK